MKGLIKKIREGKDLNEIVEFVKNSLFQNGPVKTSDLEILSYLKLFQPQLFESNKDEILSYMGLFYKDIEYEGLQSEIFKIYRSHLKEKHDKYYTPVQSKIVDGVSDNRSFSFSAPTSTGKSFVFLDLINKTLKDVVIIVPSRALINEYYYKLNKSIEDKSVNILTFVDKINTNRSVRSVFIVTPERCRELFKRKNEFDVEYFLFDEAQLSNEESKRGLYFDSIVRRADRAFPNAKFVFAHPFVKNPESQLIKNHLISDRSDSEVFNQKSVGQVYMVKDKADEFYFFGSDKDLLGHKREWYEKDPIKSALNNGKSVLFFVSKTKIVKKKFVTNFQKYLELCPKINHERVDHYIDKIIEYSGGQLHEGKDYFSEMTSWLKRGIVIHHGSLPMYIRSIVEQFTQEGFCRICFATSTLEQGINMPFDLVYIDRLESSKSLSVKNLIGRAGRSSMNNQFDFGYVVLNSTNKISSFRSIINGKEVLKEKSLLETNEFKDDDYNDFKEAILKDEFSDEYNMPERSLELLQSDDVEKVVRGILTEVFQENTSQKLLVRELAGSSGESLVLSFQRLYVIYLGRDLSPGESNVLETAIRIIIWRMQGKTFRQICMSRFAYASNYTERRNRRAHGLSIDHIGAKFITGYNDIPNKDLPVYSLFGVETNAVAVDYDQIIYDTYDYLDKLIGFKLSDIFFAIFDKYSKKYSDSEAEKLGKLIKYGTFNEKQIWLLRYGLTFEDIERLEEYVDRVDERQIIFNSNLNEVDPTHLECIERFISN